MSEDTAPAGGTVESIDLDDHARTCDGKVVCNSWRYHRCPECGATVDTFGGNVG